MSFKIGHAMQLRIDDAVRSDLKEQKGAFTIARVDGAHQTVVMPEGMVGNPGVGYQTGE